MKEQALWIKSSRRYWQENIHSRKTHSSTLEAYEVTTVFIPVDITEDVVELVAQKHLDSAGTGGTDLDTLQGWIINFGVYRKYLRICV